MKILSTLNTQEALNQRCNNVLSLTQSWSKAQPMPRDTRVDGRLLSVSISSVNVGLIVNKSFRYTSCWGKLKCVIRYTGLTCESSLSRY